VCGWVCVWVGGCGCGWVGGLEIEFGHVFG